MEPGVRNAPLAHTRSTGPMRPRSSVLRVLQEPTLLWQGPTFQALVQGVLQVFFQCLIFWAIIFVSLSFSQEHTNPLRGRLPVLRAGQEPIPMLRDSHWRRSASRVLQEHIQPLSEHPRCCFASRVHWAIFPLPLVQPTLQCAQDVRVARTPTEQAQCFARAVLLGRLAEYKAPRLFSTARCVLQATFLRACRQPPMQLAGHAGQAPTRHWQGQGPPLHA